MITVGEILVKLKLDKFCPRRNTVLPAMNQFVRRYKFFVAGDEIR